ncbi:DUF1178 family protein [Pelagibacteraceae bacterium]|jgi:hypothetical protein|nr:DUF1178 family protein [Pelagibacteraceae bacterium]|tara:strand:- start:154 stop:576 length:423 start_codon:yes stop_codon:yes gene_type:complete
MIKYNLKCKNDHEFESWFSDSHEYEKLRKKRLLECIYCSSKEINKSIMSPMVSSKKLKENRSKFLNKSLFDDKKKLLKLRKFVEQNFEFVGNKFGEKVREIYYDKKSKKSIYGTTTIDEKEALEDEGIDLLSIPWVSKDN